MIADLSRQGFVYMVAKLHNVLLKRMNCRNLTGKNPLPFENHIRLFRFTRLLENVYILRFKFFFIILFN